MFCEKPIATTLADADRMIDACERHGVLLSVDHTRRWRPLFTTARRLVAGGELGAVRTMATEHYGPRAMLFRNGTHLVDGLTFFAGTEPRWVTALLERGFESFDIYRGDGGHDPASEPSASALIAFDGDIRATYTSYKTTFPATLLTVTCDHGRLELTNDHGVVRTSGADRRLSEVMIEPEHYVYTNQLAAIEELVTALDGGGNSLVCSGTDGPLDPGDPAGNPRLTTGPATTASTSPCPAAEREIAQPFGEFALTWGLRGADPEGWSATRSLKALDAGLIHREIDTTINTTLKDVAATAEALRSRPKNTGFSELARVCDRFFGEPRHRGSSHRVYRMSWPGDPRVNIQDDKGMAKPYQVRQVIRALERLEAERQEDDK